MSYPRFALRVVASVEDVLQLDNTAEARGLSLDTYGRRGFLYSGDREAWLSIQQECRDILAGILSDAVERLPREQLRKLIDEIDIVVLGKRRVP